MSERTWCGFCGQEFGRNDETTAHLDWRMGTLEAIVDEIAMDARSLMVAAIEAAQTVE